MTGDAGGAAEGFSEAESCQGTGRLRWPVAHDCVKSMFEIVGYQAAEGPRAEGRPRNGGWLGG